MTPKFPFLESISGYRMPPSLSLEQASSQQSAEFKMSVIKKLCPSFELMVDMTGGMGIDTTFISPLFKKSIYIERNAELCSLASENFLTLGLGNVETVNADSVQYVLNLKHASLIYADPARRSASGGKLVSISQCEPNLLPLIDSLIEKCDCLMLKLSPMLDISVAIKELKYVTDIYVVSVEGECKEVLAVCKKSASDVNIHCVNLPCTAEFTFTREEESEASLHLGEPDAYLYEPNASILKAGAFKSVGEKFGLNKLHISSHLYTSNAPVENFPGRAFEILDIRKVHKEHFKDIEKANIATRNFPTSVAELRKKLGIKDGGDIYMFATTLSDGSKRMIVCRKV